MFWQCLFCNLFFSTFLLHNCCCCFGCWCGWAYSDCLVLTPLWFFRFFQWNFMSNCPNSKDLTCKACKESVDGIQLHLFSSKHPIKNVSKDDRPRLLSFVQQFMVHEWNCSVKFNHWFCRAGFFILVSGFLLVISHHVITRTIHVIIALWTIKWSCLLSASITGPFSAVSAGLIYQQGNPRRFMGIGAMLNLGKVLRYSHLQEKNTSENWIQIEHVRVVCRLDLGWTEMHCTCRLDHADLFVKKLRVSKCMKGATFYHGDEVLILQ